MKRLPEATQAALESLLAMPGEMVALQEPSELEPVPLPEELAPPSEDQALPNPLQHLRMDPGRVGLATMLEEMAKLRLIRELKLPDNLFPGLSRKVLTVYRNRASIEEPSRLRAHPKPLRLTLLAVLCSMRTQEITDGLVELLIQIVHKIDVCAEKRVEEEYANEFKRIANKEGLLYRIAEASVEHPDEPVCKVIFEVASEKLLRDLIKEYKAKSPAFRKQVHLIMRASYSHHYRRMVPELLDILDFRSNNACYLETMVTSQVSHLEPFILVLGRWYFLHWQNIPSMICEEIDILLQLFEVNDAQQHPPKNEQNSMAYPPFAKVRLGM